MLCIALRVYKVLTSSLVVSHLVATYYAYLLLIFLTANFPQFYSATYMEKSAQKAILLKHQKSENITAVRKTTKFSVYESK